MSDSSVDPNVLATLVPIKMLTPEHCRELAAKSELCTFTKGDVIFKQAQKVEKIIYLMSADTWYACYQRVSQISIGFILGHFEEFRDVKNHDSQS